jgi:hypothetical protein
MFTKPTHRLEYGTHELLGKFEVIAFTNKNNDNWIFNGNVLQYAMVLSRNEMQNVTEIEAMIESAGSLDLAKDQKYLKCLIVLNSHESVLKEVTSLVKTVTFNANCELSIAEYAKVFNNKIIVSVLDTRVIIAKTQIWSLDTNI